MMVDKKNQYQKIYEDHEWYGNSEKGRCPSVRLLPHYKEHLGKTNAELGCGRGGLVNLLRKQGINCDGYDMIDLNNGMNVSDITKDLKISGDTVICIDVIEHILDEDLEGLYKNFKKFNKQIFSIHNGPSLLDGVELHINIKPFKVWENIIRQRGFHIIKEVQIHAKQKLYITELK